MRENPILYVVLNKELNMSAGKAAAQAVHAAMMLGEKGNSFINSTKRTVIVLEAENAEQIKNLQEYISFTPLLADYYIDEGVNEVGAYSVTALACEPIAAGDEEFRGIFAPFKLYGSRSDEYDDDYDEEYKPDSVELTVLKRIEYTLGVMNSNLAPKTNVKKPNAFKRFMLRRKGLIS